MFGLVRLISPLLLAGGAIIGWLATRSKNEDEKNQWRDTSLDDWRTEREQERETERQARAEARETAINEGVSEESESIEQQQRIGG